LHRCLQRHGISRLPDVEDGKARKRKFKVYPIGYFHIDIAEVRTQEGRPYLFVAIDRTSKFAFTELHEKATTAVSREFLLHLIAAVPYKIHTVLTDNGLHFTDPRGTNWTAAEIKELIARKEPFRAHAFVYTCAHADIDHRLTKPKHPWTNGQVERTERSKRPPSKDSTTRPTISFAAISPTSLPPTTSPNASRPSKASHPTSTSASSGQRSLTDSPSTRSRKCRD
jgi:transposase InsO family protein